MDREPLTWLREQLEQAHPDLLREMMAAITQQRMAAEAQEAGGAEFGEGSAERVNSRNGYRLRDWDTRVGSIQLAVPKLRQGSYFPDWLLTPRRRAERAMVAVIAQAYLAGVSTRRVEALVQTLGIQSISKSQVSELCKSLDPMVADLVRSIFAQPDMAAVWAQHERIVEQLQSRFAQAATVLSEAGPEVLAFATFPKEHWRQIWSNNPQERLNKEVRRRTDVAGIFPDRAAVVRLVGAVLAEQHDEWLVASRRYLSAESLKTAQVAAIEEKEVTPELAAAN